MGFFKRGNDKSPGKGLQTTERLCSAGHAMGRDWTECPYCKAAANAGRQTRVSDSGELGATRVSADAGVQPQGLRETRVSYEADASPAPGVRVTRIDPLVVAQESGMSGHSAGPVTPAAPAADFRAGGRGPGTRIVMNDDPRPPAARIQNAPARRITGVIHTYTWDAAGMLFVVRDGRNYGGSGVVALEGNRDADIKVADPSMSGAHFLILCQSGHYRISDCNSTNGTFVDDKLVDTNGIELVDGARIQAGATVFIFQKIKPHVAEAKNP